MWWDNSDLATSADPTDIQVHAQTSNPAYYTNQNVIYWLKATLDDYIILYPEEATRWVSFNVNIQNCQVTALSFSDPTSSYNWDPSDSMIKYNIYTPLTWITMDLFTETADTSTTAAISQWMTD